MANGIQRRPTQFPWVSPSGGAIGPAGMTPEELKIHQGPKVDRPEIAPIAQRGPVEFIAPSTSSDQLRLAVPEAANPFATPTGPKHDHMMVRKALARTHTATAGELVRLLKAPPDGLNEAALGQMRASLAREHAMHGVLQKVQEMQDMIYGRILGGQEA